jgi:glycosyltransferase involved in cell wall biosynthesis
MRGADVWVLVPVYNERTMVGRTITDLLQHFENVLCVDGSVVGSGEIAHAAGAPVVRHVVNQAKGAALQTGSDYLLRHTDAQHVVTFHADGQHVGADA